MEEGLEKEDFHCPLFCPKVILKVIFFILKARDLIEFVMDFYFFLDFFTKDINDGFFPKVKSFKISFSH